MVGGSKLANRVFFQYDSTEDLCRELYQDWWERYLEMRSTSDKVKKAYGKDLAFLLPKIPIYQFSPVQSMGAVLGSRNFHGTGHKKQTRTCRTGCEDIRSDAEIFLSQLLEEAIHIRMRFPVTMKCPSGMFAKLVQVEDAREPESDITRLLDRAVQSYNIDYFSWRAKRSTPPRKRGTLIQQCKCAPVEQKKLAPRNWRKTAKRARADSSEDDSDAEDGPRTMSPSSSLSCMDYTWLPESYDLDTLFTDHAPQNHPYREDAMELAEAVQMWASWPRQHTSYIPERFL